LVRRIEKLGLYTHQAENGCVFWSGQASRLAEQSFHRYRCCFWRLRAQGIDILQYLFALGAVLVLMLQASRIPHNLSASSDSARIWVLLQMRSPPNR
jgi:hypothetical protein